MQKRMMLLINPNAGRGAYRSVLGDVLKVFYDGGWLPTVLFTQEQGDAPTLVTDHASDFDLVVCIGGDGTLSEVCSGMMLLESQRPIGYIPQGTANDVARTLGIPFKPAEAAHHILSGSEMPYDIGQFGCNSFFTYIAAFGAFTEVSYATPQERKRTWGHMAYMLEALRHLGQLTTSHAIVEYDGGVLEDEFLFGAVANSTSVAGLVKLDNDKVDLADGIFEILLVKKPRDLLDLNNIVISILSSDFSGPNVSFLKSREVRILFDEPIAWTRDGEDGGKHRDVFIQSRHPGVTLLV
ncbi:MAG: diacylglycerol kinase family lipid kinase [Oscillospiraceae bacterium]|nr:diacylglycerol kinase family lipid kinase [Oscillospiraceae bacterium]